MSYRLATSDNTTIATCMTLGNAFTALDNWCHDNNGWYDFECIYHKFDNEIGIDVHTQDCRIKQFSIRYD